MPIIYDSNNQSFNLMTKNSSYIICILENKLLLHAHYGKKIYDLSNVIDTVYEAGGAFNPVDSDIERKAFSSDAAMLEYSFFGTTDLRTCGFNGVFENGTNYVRPYYKSHRIFDGKPKLPGLPATYTEDDSEAQTLEITLKDDVLNVEFLIRYTVFENVDAITRNIEIKNLANEGFDIKSALSMTVDFSDKDFDFVHMFGGWARERQIQKIPLINGGQYVDSKRGSSSHHHSPFMALARKNANETCGEVFGFSLVYSGNFFAGVEVNSGNISRAMMGINPYNFNWRLEGGETFVTPEVVMVYSDKGFGEMSRTYHTIYRTRLVRGKYRDSHRPILINNWEGTYFDFDEEKIVNIAKKAKETGVELMVLDDGWFGHRDDDKSSLGDWYEYEKKLPNGIKGLAEKIDALGMKFGLWYEPEMISPDSELYRKHPDWCISVEGRLQNYGRNQLILDLSRKDVCDYIKGFLTDMLSKAKISYIKWDMNRNFSEVGSALLPKDKMQELPHRYMLNLYDILEYITTAFPDVLFEGCSGGGGRFDAGMLYYFPQYWCSDDSDAIERLYLQYGTSMVMPATTIGAHVSACPNHQVERTTPLSTRGYVAMCGSFGYELNPLAISQEVLDEMKEQITLFKEIRDVIHYGDMYRLSSPFEGENTCFSYVTKDKSKAVSVYVTIMGRPWPGSHRLKFDGLDENAVYIDKDTKKEYSGSLLMNIGLPVCDCKDFESRLFIFEKK